MTGRSWSRTEDGGGWTEDRVGRRERRREEGQEYRSEGALADIRKDVLNPDRETHFTSHISIFIRRSTVWRRQGG